ncbi:MAG: hypothetical protein ACRD9W_23575 [Terriglobia bacterium]
MSAEAKKKLPISRIISVTSLLLAMTALFLALRKPQPVAAPQPAAVVSANAQSFQTKVDQLAQSQADGQAGAEVHLTPGEVNAAILQSSGGVPATPVVSATTNGTPDVNAPIEGGAIDPSTLGEPIVSFDGDQIKGQFLSEVAGKKVYVTIAGHLGSKDGYANFEPTEFKVGDLNVPVSLVNDALQKKLLEQRDRLKLPDYVSDIHVENGELVIKQK